MKQRMFVMTAICQEVFHVQDVARMEAGLRMFLYAVDVSKNI